MIGIFILINQAINALRFGHFLSFGYQAASGNSFVFDITKIVKAVVGNLLSPGRGMLLYYPVSLLSIWGFWKLWGHTPLKVLVFASMPVLALFLYSAWFEWGAGISWGPRFLIPVLPYVTILAVWGAGLPGMCQ